MVMQKDKKCHLPTESTDMNRRAARHRVKTFVFRLLTTNACRSRPISRRLQRRSQALALDPEFIPLNKHHTQSVSFMCATLCVLYSVFRVSSFRSHAAGECIKYMSTCDGCVLAARGQMSFPCSLVAVHRVVPSYTKRGSLPLDS